MLAAFLGHPLDLYTEPWRIGDSQSLLDTQQLLGCFYIF